MERNYVTVTLLKNPTHPSLSVRQDFAIRDSRVLMHIILATGAATMIIVIFSTKN